ncbi:WD repeat-containing protein 44-like [Canna indica]|uniref:WD repeat-containing protein 44-like n=1 Tax=Canna indica TaxID=4628 RepID=A0AAQ3K9E1_9LILI|nr:WD repeat-containing protein 44-like [Canna indica]
MSPCNHISTKDVEFHEKEEDVFFDSLDYLDSSFDPELSTSYLVEKPEFELGKFPIKFWTEELSTVHERRNKFLRETGFDKLILSQLICSKEPEEVRHNVPLEKMELQLMLDSLSSPVLGGDNNSTSSTEVLDAKENLLAHNLVENGATNTRNEVGLNRMTIRQEVETHVGSHIAQPFLDQVTKPDGVQRQRVLYENKGLRRRWWRRLTLKRNEGGISRKDVPSGYSELPKTVVKKIINDNSIEIREFRMTQEVNAHKDLIKTMKFSPCGMYLATGGEDGAVRVWKVREADTSHNCLIADGPCSLLDETEKFKLRLKDLNCASAVNSDEVLKLEEVPLHEYFGHTNDILDLSWSRSNYLLSASKDKTVRMWKVGCDSCVKVFYHNDYVTCIQVNPDDDRYFISGSLDGKVRVWSVDENRVVNWIDTRNIITSICYYTNGKGFAVGTLSGKSRFYVYSDNNLQLDKELCLWGKKKLVGKQITGLQFCPGDSKKIMITSVDSKVRISDGSDIIETFGGSWKSKGHVVASFTADGRHIVSVDENSNISIRDYDNSDFTSAKGAKSVYPREHFFSEGVTVAVPWPSIGKKEAHSSIPLEQVSEPFVKIQHQKFFSLGSCFRATGYPSISATWPEEKLPARPISSEQVYHHTRTHNNLSQPCQGRKGLGSLLDASSLVIVTGSCSGTIRLFRYSRILVKFC